MYLKKSLLVSLLLMLFAVMQIGITNHEISHIDITAESSHQQSPEPDKNATTEHCAWCLVYSQVDAALPSIATHIAIDASVYFISTAYIAYLLVVISRAYQARAPPSLI